MSPIRPLHRQIALAATGVLLVAVWFAAPRAVALWRSYRELSAAEAAAGSLIGQPPGDWRTKDIDGSPHTLADYRGQVLVLDFWYAGCGHCLDAMPKMVALAEAFDGQGVVVLGVNADTGDEVRRREQFLSQFATRYPRQLIHLVDADDGPALHEQYAVTLLPTAVVIDQRGIVRHVHCGNWPWLQSTIAGEIRTLLTEARASR